MKTQCLLLVGCLLSVQLYITDTMPRVLAAQDTPTSLNHQTHTAPPLPVAYAVSLPISVRRPSTLTTSNPSLGTRIVVQGATHSAQPVARLEQTDSLLENLERSLEQIVNAERARAGLKTLMFDASLADVARAHSAEMRDREYFGHESPTAGLHNAVERYRTAYGMIPPVVAENLYWAKGSNQHLLSEKILDRAHRALMRSPGHRDNILCRKLTHIGIGIVTDARGDIWITQMFARM
jgi:uncharacterized protein YkwD